ncbi:MAG: hypothetical protein ACI81O_000481 [Cyclobacteriaceae bacterium]|jgi:hypothetical protein
MRLDPEHGRELLLDASSTTRGATLPAKNYGD